MREVVPVECSFRGLPLLVTQISDSSGRVWVQHQYLGRLGVDLETTGRMPDRFELELIVNGPGWLASLRSIRRAVDEASPGVFTHPYLGRFTGVLADLQVTHTDRAHDVARARVTFLAGGGEAVAFAATRTTASAAAAAEMASAAAGTALAALADT